MRLVILTLFALTGLVVGFRAADNEHLVRDVGAMFLALGAVAIGALVTRTTTAARLAGAAWLVFSVPHALYHLTHLHVFQPLDQAINAISLIALVLLALTVLVLPAKVSAGAVRSSVP